MNKNAINFFSFRALKGLNGFMYSNVFISANSGAYVSNVNSIF